MCFQRFSAVFGDFEFFPYPNDPLTFSHSPPKITKNHQKQKKKEYSFRFSVFSTLFTNFLDLKLFSRKLPTLSEPQKKFQLDRPRIFALLGPQKLKK